MGQGYGRAVAIAIAVLTLGIGPWLGLASRAPGAEWSSFATAGWGGSLVGHLPIINDDPIVPARATGCTCRQVTVEAKNVVKDAKVETGDAEVINKTITYIAPTYGDDDVDIDQDAVARSGDAVAGQVLAVDGGSNGCAHVIVHAKNIVQDAKVRSGDATARNESLILIDPRLKGDLDIDVDQNAEATSGAAIAGQVIGVKGGGGPCGSVILDALNDVKNVDVRSGDATMSNLSRVLACKDDSCLDEARKLLKLEGVESVDVCDGTGCHTVPAKQFVGMLKQEKDDSVDADVFSSPSPAPDDPNASGSDDDHATPRPTLGPPFMRRERAHVVKSPEPSPSPTPTPETV